MLRASRSTTWGSCKPPRSWRSTLPFLSRRGFTSVADLSKQPKPGQQLHGFTVKRVKQVPELELAAFHLQHDKTGAEHLHVARDDSNNVFSIGFKTNPPDDTGVPHILEHTTLCGSKKYPVRDPFFKMLPRSLSNFMNAFTSPDHTTYPFSTTNPQDFKNLMSVYLDATLCPLLKEDDFSQEGWRIGPENPFASTVEDGNPEDKRLVFKGVVYNEMKGQMSDASYLYYIRFQDHLIPAIHNSGGDPRKITDLTHEQLKTFHSGHYHPSNAKLFTYGNFPIEEHLKEINESLDKFSRIWVDTDIKTPNNLSNGPQYITIHGPKDPMVPEDMQYKTSTTWLTGETSDTVETFSLGVLAALLMNGYGSPFYRNLIEAGLGSDFTPNTGFDSAGKIGVFSVGLNGVKQEDIPKVKAAIVRTLETAHSNGFNQAKVDGILHQLELALKHKTANFGMNLMQRLKPGWFNGVDPFDALEWNNTVSSFKFLYAKGGYLEGLIQKYFLNDHTLTFTMEPSETFGKELAVEEEGRLSSKITEATKNYSNVEEARKAFEKRELELLKIQEDARYADLSCLPSLHVKDIERRKERKILAHTEIGDIKVQWRAAPTNGLTYFRAVNTFANVPDELREMIPLFCDAVMRLGSKSRTMEQLEELIKLKTGGISVGYHSSPSPLSLEGFEEGLAFTGYALDGNVPDMYDLIRTIVLDTDFESPEAEKKIRQLLQTAASGAADDIASSGHSFARTYAEAGLTPAGRVREQTSGLTQIKLTAKLAARLDTESLTDVISKLKTIQSIAIANARSMRVAINCGAESINANTVALEKFISSLPGPVPSVSSNGQGIVYPRNSKTFFALPYQVYYGGLAIPTVPYTDSSSASLQILAQLLTHKHLHHEIREKGGAYGGGSVMTGLTGMFSFYSYRDPNPANTMRVISGAGAWARDREWQERDIEEAKLSYFQNLDAPQSVSQEGMRLFLSGVDDEMAQRRREQVLDVTADGVRKAAEQFLIDGAKRSNAVVLGKPMIPANGWSDWKVEDLGIELEAAIEE
ncbi:Metalloenzyme, LuxS/M16 peptidase-like protein [Lineolata rhizophorae]|uniref:Presequence protease, mitochondrial n=1 Tax=Lineolata rhizophorae TaxID=578093 RepID=A0A6A6NSX8_9PEZI|nr:Metalloenzyme, LuxS/M16 peptidase-like protein [Lineolata rhizophorae]